MKKLFIITGLLFFLVSCNKDLSHLNIDTKRSSTVPSYTLFSNGQRNLVDRLATPDVNTNIFQLITQQWTEITYLDESNYDLGTRTISDNWWRGMYKQVLVNFEASRKIIPDDVLDPDIQKNELAMLDIMEVYTWSVLVNTYGNIPYTEALDPANLFPKYDDAQTVYTDLLNRLDADIAALNPAAGSFGNADLIYGGDIVAWQKFANSLKLRMGMVIADSDAAKSKSIVESAAAKVFTSNSENASFTYYAATPNVNPVWTNAVQSGRDDYAPASTIIGIMNAISDPRRPFFFNLRGNPTYKGGEPGAGSADPSIARPSDKVEQPDFPYVLISYSEVEFDLAEAIERGYSVGGTAAEHYTSAVSASLDYWGVSAANATAYLAQPSVAYATATGTYKQKIGIQKYLALYMDGFDAWVEQRRLDYPILVVPADPQSGYPVRYTYPDNEVNLNSASWSTAKTAMGGTDKVETKLFWDKF
ncbi:MAG: SusD/RagB family nutrient-binding outer membrane lipoprotein [Ginsengibacter sp.]